MTDLRLSNSEMKDYRRCQRKWYLGTYLELRLRQGPEPGSPLSIGTLVHDALAAYYDPSVKADPVLYAEQIFQDAVAESPAYESALAREFELIRIMLSGYMEWLEETGADQDIEVLGTERMAEIEVAEGITLLSKLDAPVRRVSDGTRMAFEHKTVQSLGAPLSLLKLDTQLLTEHLVLFLSARMEGATDAEAYAQCTGIVYNMLRKVKRTASAKPPFYGREEVPHNIHELRNHWRHVLAIAREIQRTRARLDAGESHHTACVPNPTRECTWDCDFFRVCVLADDGSDFEGALEDTYEKRDPLERYQGAQPLVGSMQEGGA